MRLNNHYWLVGAGAFLAVTLFVGLAMIQGRPGFPLDDAWIHQTYARNLIRDGRWHYVPGVVSTGSTAPLWTFVLALGYALRLPYLWWAYLVGGLSLLWLSWAGMRLWRILWPAGAQHAWLAGLALVFTWPLVWAAASGMETLLFAALGLSLLAGYSVYSGGDSETLQAAGTGFRSLSLLGIFSGLIILVRPDGLVLLALIGLGLWLAPEAKLRRLRRLLVWGGAALLPLIPYFVFNLWASGNLWPSTFYAKQAEYAEYLAQPLWIRLSHLLYFSLGGPPAGWRGMSSAHLLLAPGLLIMAWRSLQADWQARRLYYLLPLLWGAGHIFLYAWRLPVTYQHGRYLLAAVPVWILYGLAGWWWLLGYWAGNNRTAWLVRRVVGLTFTILTLLFLLLGAQVYARDVAFIEGEMVAVARWLAQHTPPDALIAAHDIGAVGYFAERPLLDLAGLISPDVIPLLANEQAVSDYILNSKADYLVTAPGWPYDDVTASQVAVHLYTTNYAWTRAQGWNNMSVYRLNLP